MVAHPLHVHCGDCGAEAARAAGLPGEVIAWRDSAAVGPSALDPAEHRRLRSAWWGVAEDEAQDPKSLCHAGEIVLWFGPDPWEQFALVEVLAGLPGGQTVSLVPLDQGVGPMNPSALAPLFARRHDVTALYPLARGLWADICHDERGALRTWIARLRGEERLPHLARALGRVLDDREYDRTEKQVRALIDQGVTDLRDLMSRLGEIEDPDHGVWYGDMIVERIRRRFVR